MRLQKQSARHPKPSRLTGWCSYPAYRLVISGSRFIRFERATDLWSFTTRIFAQIRLLSLPRYIPNNLLRADKLPSPDATWEEIGRFALTFDGYRSCGSVEACAEVANARRMESLSDLRICLFFEQRRWRDFGEEPTEEDMKYIHELVEQIRRRVQAANDLLS